MARRELVICDRCGTTSDKVPVSGICFATGTRYNGVETDTVYHDVDLCPKCLVTAIVLLTNKMTFEEQKDWLKKILPKVTIT